MQTLLEWAKETGSALLRARIESNANWVHLAHSEFGDAIVARLGITFKFLSTVSTFRIRERNREDDDPFRDILGWSQKDTNPSLRTMRLIKRLNMEAAGKGLEVVLSPTRITHLHLYSRDKFNERAREETDSLISSSPEFWASRIDRAKQLGKEFIRREEIKRSTYTLGIRVVIFAPDGNRLCRYFDREVKAR